MEDIQDLDTFTEAEGRRLLAAAFETAPAGPVLAGSGQAGDGLTSDGLTGAQLLRRVRRRTARRRRVRTLVPAGAVAAAGGAVALVVTLTATVADAPSALAAVTAAAAKTSAQSFSVTATHPEVTVSGRPYPARPWMTGVFDPKRGLGEETVDGTTQVRFIGGRVYVHSLTHGKPWVASRIRPLMSPATPGGPSFGNLRIAQGFNGNEPIDPAALLGLLKSAGAVQAEGAASGPGWTGTKYAFTIPVFKGKFATTASGTVYVDNQGRVRRLVTTVTSAGVASTDDVTFGGFGVQVSVSAPSASQVEYLPANMYLTAL